MTDNLFTEVGSLRLNMVSIPKDGFAFNTSPLRKNKAQYKIYWDEYIGYIKNGENAKSNRRMRILEFVFLRNLLDIYETLGRKKAGSEELHPNGCCIPGVSRLLVEPEGIYHMCERASYESLCIGSYSQGIKEKKVHSIVDEYCKKSEKDCRRCWALDLCGVCYLSACDSEGKFCLESKRKSCREQRKGIHNALKSIAHILEVNPDYLNSKLRLAMKQQYRLT